MRIALVITELHPGGAEKCFAHLACFLKREGHEVAVWELWPPPPKDRQQLFKLLSDAGVPTKSLGAVRAWDFPQLVRQLRNDLRAFAPQIIQSFLFHANVVSAYSAKGLNASLLGGVRVSQPQRVRNWLQRWAASKMTRVVCVSESVAEHCQRTQGISRNKLVVIPNGIDTSSIDSKIAAHDANWSNLGLPSNSRIALFVGRLDEQKGVAEMLSSADQFLAKSPDAHLVLMGRGPLEASLRDKSSASPFAEHIHFAGWNENAPGWMTKSEMLLLPARYEGMPNVILEAMAARTPVVAFNVDGVRELLGNGETGQSQTAPAGDMNAFWSRASALYRDSALQARCTEKNRSRVEQFFDLRKQLLRYQELYVECAKSNLRD